MTAALVMHVLLVGGTTIVPCLFYYLKDPAQSTYIAIYIATYIVTYIVIYIVTYIVTYIITYILKCRWSILVSAMSGVHPSHSLSHPLATHLTNDSGIDQSNSTSF
ncbi:hypothetical protein BDF14DRAFT_495347 [Spinellus fusiger]|nr:hypothetical protein BDF14DRAFT_495347 [Spinellus fusiger]